MLPRQAPDYFNKIQRLSQERWKKLEDDPILAAPWHQLFEQVKSPYHVISELLQNADDAGATQAEVKINGEHFYFIHNGEDFNESSFSSLCQFGYSNKRTLHTIGFRGLGFKSTFSLGGRVEVLTPTLAIGFDETRFTFPVWLSNAPQYQDTIIHIKLEDDRKQKFLEEEIKRWASSVAPMLFFRNIKLLILNGERVKKEFESNGPVPGSQWVKLIAGTHTQRVLYVRSPELNFPNNAIDEIKKERGVADENLELPPFSVEIIFGLSSPQRLYVVLPAKINLSLPFSCNAPFVQDPARTGIKDPILSPANTWLLDQIGELAANTFHYWLSNSSLDISDRAGAYDFLPNPLMGVDVLGSSDCTEHILGSIKKNLDALPNILTCDGNIGKDNECLGSPREFNEVWTSEQILSLFGSGETMIVASELSDNVRLRLQKWGWLTPLDLQKIFSRLEQSPYPPLPSFEQLVKLWSFIYMDGKRLWKYQFQREERFQKLALVPIKNSDSLSPCKNILAPLGLKEKQFTDIEWIFLTRFFQIADETWIEYISKQRDVDIEDPTINNAWSLLKEFNLTTSVSKETVINQVVEKIFSHGKPDEADGIKIAHIAARLNMPLLQKMKFLCADGNWRIPQETFLRGVDKNVEQVLPDKWIETYSINKVYFSAAGPDLIPVLTEWLKSILGSSCKAMTPKSTNKYLNSRSALAKECERLGGTVPSEYKYTSSNFSLLTYQFPKDILAFWNEKAKETPEFWAEIVQLIAADWNSDWEKWIVAKLNQDGNKYTYPLQTGTLVADWVYDLRQEQCVLDSLSRPAYPSEVMCTTPETSHLQGIERFIHPKLDKPEFRKLLELLGVRTVATDANKIIERLKSLSKLPGEIPLREVIRLYEALEQFVLNGATEHVVNIKAIFGSEALLISQERTWHKSSEIFQRNDDQIPGVPILHENVDFQALWNRLGIPERPTFSSVIEWLHLLPFGKKLGEQDCNRVQTILRRYGIQVWEQCRGWLSLNGEWLPADQLRWQTGSAAITNSGLFPFVKQGTADLTMLESLVAISPEIPFLEQSIEYRLDHVYGIPNAGQQPAWLSPLAQCIGRIKGNGSEPDVELLSLANQLGRTKLQQVDRLEVTPYLENQPAADHQFLKALWKDERLYVVQDDNMLFHEIADAIAFRFAPELKRAIQDCVERDPFWIQSYFEKYFSLTPFDIVQIAEQTETIEILKVQDIASKGEEHAERNTPNEGALISVSFSANKAIAAPDIVDEKDEIPTGTEDKPATNAPSLKERLMEYFTSIGFSDSGSNGTMINTKGDKLQKSKRVFRWEVVDRGGYIKMLYWVGDKPLQAGVEIPAEVWELFKKHQKTCLLLPDDAGNFQEYNWQTINGLLQKKALELLQSSYRLRKQEE
jgi:hypothetical protein